MKNAVIFEQQLSLVSSMTTPLYTYTLYITIVIITLARKRWKLRCIATWGTYRRHAIRCSL